MFFAYFKNRLRRTRRDSLDAIKQMKLPEDDEKREREIVEKTLAQVFARVTVIVAAPFYGVCSALVRNILLTSSGPAPEVSGERFVLKR